MSHRMGSESRRIQIALAALCGAAWLGCGGGGGGGGADNPTGGSEGSPPSPVTTLQARATAADQVALSWRASTDDVAVVEYQVHRDGTLVGAPSGTAWTDRGLQANTTYCYRVYADDGENRSSEGNEACATTPGGSAAVTLAVQRSGTGAGTVTGTGISCGTDCSEAFASGATVTLTATAAAGSTFASWSGCDAPAGATCTMTMSASKTVTATFTAAVPSYTLSVAKAGTGAGTVSGAGIACGADCTEAFASGATVTLVAAPASSSTFVSWSGCDAPSGTTCTMTMSAGKTVTARFDLLPVNHTLTVTRTGTGSGTVSGTGISCGTDCSEKFGSGATVTLTATPASGSKFISWSGCDAPSGTTCTMTMGADKTVAASFDLTPVTYTLTVSRIGNGTGTVTGTSIGCGSTCSASYAPGASVTLTASAATGSTFSSWAGCDTTSGASCTVTMSSSRTVTASFALAPAVPAAPSQLTTAALTATAVTLSWKDNSTDETGFEVGVCTGLASVDGNGNRWCTSGFTALGNAAANATSVSISNLNPSTRYSIYVRSFNGAGFSASAPVVEFSTPSATQTVALNAVASNCVEYTAYDSSWANKAFPSCYPEVGVDWYSDALSSCVANPAAASLVKFNTAGLSGKTIDSATLTLQVRTKWVGAYPQNFRISAVATSWSPTSISWNAMMSSTFLYYTESWLTLAYPTSSSQTYNVDLRTTVQRWADGTYVNNGLAFQSAYYGGCLGAVALDRYEFWYPTLTVTYH